MNYFNENIRKPVENGQELDDIFAMREKVTELEKLVAQQADEIACLKSAMADNLRRLQLIEDQQSTSREEDEVPLHEYPSVFEEDFNSIVCVNSKSLYNLAETPHNNFMDSISSTNHAQHQFISPRRSQNKHSSGSASRSTGSGFSRINNSSHFDFSGLKKQSQSHHIKSLKSPRNIIKQRSTNATNSSPALNHLGTSNGKESIYNKEEGILKIYIRGRPLNFYVPNYAQPIDTESQGKLPTETLKLEWVYGYRGRDARNNIYYLPTGEIIYFIAAVVILYNMEEQTQRHYLGHNDDVKSIAVHPDKITIATGQVAGHSKLQGKPHVRIWSSVNLNTLHVIGLGEFERSICCLAFSQADGGTLLAAVDEANEHILSLWNWDKEKKITETKSSTEPILSVDFQPTENSKLMTCGKNHLAFWTLEDNQINKKQAIYEKYEKPKFVLCQTFTENGELITGDSSGNIIIWNNETHKIEKIVTSAHEGPIFSLMLTKNNTILSGGGKDRLIREWDNKLNALPNDKSIPEMYGPVRMLSSGPGGMVLVGTTRNCILQMFIGSSSSSANDSLRAVVESHTDELWGLSTHPKQHRFASVSYDKTLAYWDSLTRQLIWRKELPSIDVMHCVCFHPLMDLLAVGCASGRWIVLDIVTRETIRVHTDGNELIQCIQFSPDGNMLAVGSRDNSIYVYSVTDNATKYSRIGKCSGHSSFITHMDWSSNGLYIRSNSGDYELLYWSAASCKQISNSESIREVEWTSSNCILDWTTAGIWSEGSDGTDINACCRGHNLPMLCTADDFGKVCLFNYPCPYKKALHHQYRGHSSHVTNVKFLFDDSRIISSGGKDSSLMQWEII